MLLEQPFIVSSEKSDYLERVASGVQRPLFVWLLSKMSLNSPESGQFGRCWSTLSQGLSTFPFGNCFRPQRVPWLGADRRRQVSSCALSLAPIVRDRSRSYNLCLDATSKALDATSKATSSGLTV